MTSCEAILILSIKVFSVIARWEQPLESVGRRYCVDPNVLAAQMWHESRGNPNAIGLAGEIGLLQIIPSNNLVRPDLSFHWRPTGEALADPYFNIEYAGRILRQLLNETHSVRESLALYNCGAEKLYSDRCGRYGGYNYADKVLATYREWTIYLLIDKREKRFEDCFVNQQC